MDGRFAGGQNVFCLTKRKSSTRYLNSWIYSIGILLLFRQVSNRCALGSDAPCIASLPFERELELPDKIWLTNGINSFNLFFGGGGKTASALNRLLGHERHHNRTLWKPRTAFFLYCHMKEKKKKTTIPWLALNHIDHFVFIVHSYRLQTRLTVLQYLIRVWFVYVIKLFRGNGWTFWNHRSSLHAVH